jgi:hypothetical protein
MTKWRYSSTNLNLGTIWCGQLRGPDALNRENPPPPPHTHTHTRWIGYWVDSKDDPDAQEMSLAPVSDRTPIPRSSPQSGHSTSISRVHRTVGYIWWNTFFTSPKAFLGMAGGVRRAQGRGVEFRNPLRLTPLVRSWYNNECIEYLTNILEIIALNTSIALFTWRQIATRYIYLSSPPSNPNGWVILPTECICVFRTALRINRHHFSTQH